MRAHNYYAAPGFERAGLRRRDSGWIVERIADPASLFVPVWRNQNLIIEIDGGEPRAVVLGWGGQVPPIAYLDPARCPSRMLTPSARRCGEPCVALSPPSQGPEAQSRRPGNWLGRAGRLCPQPPVQ